MDDLISELTYRSYKYNRERSPEITIEGWDIVFTPKTEELEARYQKERGENENRSKTD
jgi:hypothetical protein